MVQVMERLAAIRLSARLQPTAPLPIPVLALHQPQGHRAVRAAEISLIYPAAGEPVEHLRKRLAAQRGGEAVRLFLVAQVVARLQPLAKPRKPTLVRAAAVVEWVPLLISARPEGARAVRYNISLLHRLQLTAMLLVQMVLVAQQARAVLQALLEQEVLSL